MIPIIDTINANAVNTTMTVSYVVIAHHLRFSDFPKTSRNVNFEGLRTFVMTTKDNHLPYTAVPFMIITYHIFSNYSFRQNSAYTVFDDLLSPVVSRRIFNIQRHYWRTVFNNDVVFLLWTSLKQRALPVVVRRSDVASLTCTRHIFKNYPYFSINIGYFIHPFLKFFKIRAHVLKQINLAYLFHIFIKIAHD